MNIGDCLNKAKKYTEINIKYDFYPGEVKQILKSISTFAVGNKETKKNPDSSPASIIRERNYRDCTAKVQKYEL